MLSISSPLVAVTSDKRLATQVIIMAFISVTITHIYERMRPRRF
jgi:hypothetical protein